MTRKEYRRAAAALSVYHHGADKTWRQAVARFVLIPGGRPERLVAVAIAIAEAWDRRGRPTDAYHCDPLAARGAGSRAYPARTGNRHDTRSVWDGPDRPLGGGSGGKRRVARPGDPHPLWFGPSPRFYTVEVF